MSDNTSLNKVQNDTNATMLLVIITFAIATVVTSLSSLYILKFFNSLTQSISDNFFFVFQHPWIWLNTQAGNYKIIHIDNNFIAYAIYSISILLPVVITLYLTYIVCKFNQSTSGAEILIKGVHVETDTSKGFAIAEAMLAGASGYRVHENIRINKQQENAHTLVAGATRSGKSQTIAHMLEDIYNVKERAVVFDLKGDLVARMFTLKGVAIINPADSRSLYWHIAKDIRSASSCRMLANSFLPKNPKDSQPMFGDNARSILSGLLIALCVKKPSTWDWQDFANITNLTPAKQKRILETVNHKDCTNAANIISLDHKSGEPSKTTASVYSSLAPAVSTLNQIASWWGKAPASGGFSLKEFVKKPKQDNHFIIMSAQAHLMDTEYAPLYAAFYSMLINFGVEPSIPQNDGRRLHIVVDEMALIGRFPLTKLLQFGAGFGLSFCGGIQEVAGLSKYSKEEITTILSNINTLVVGKLNDNETAGLIASLFGKQRTERQNIQANAQGISTSYSAQDRDALLDSDFLNMPKASLKNGYEMFLRTDSDYGPVRVKLHYNVIPRQSITEAFIPVSDDNEFSTPRKSSAPKSKRKQRSSGGGSGLNKQQNKQLSSTKKEQETTDYKTTTINIDPEKSKSAGKVIAATEAINPIEDEAVELAGEALGAPDGAANALNLALEIADIVIESTAVSSAVSISTSSEPLEDKPKKRLRFRKKIIETEEEAE